VFPLLELYLDQFLIFVLILTRISGLMMTAPFFAANYVPMRVRAFLAVGLAVLIAPLHWGTPVAHPENLIHFLTLLGCEAVVGVTLGLGVMILFAGLQVAGHVVGHMSGMHLADVADPSFDSSIPVFAQLMNLVALAVFVIIGGHRQVMDALLDTFRWTPPGSGTVSSGIVETMTAVLAQSFVLGIRAAAPAIVALLMSVLVMGLISRTLPQLNVLAVGFGLNSIIMLSALAVSLGSIAWMFQDQVEPTIDTVRELFRPAR